MSNYHILSGNKDGNVFTVAMHVPIPNTDNEVGVNYRTALTEMLSDTTSIVPFIIAGEQTQLDAGELVEVSMRFNTHPGETLVNKRDRLDILYGTVVTQAQAQYGNILSYWGYSRDIP